MKNALEREKDTIALRVGLAVHFDTTVDHRHDAVAKFLVNESLDGSTIHEDTLGIRY